MGIKNKMVERKTSDVSLGVIELEKDSLGFNIPSLRVNASKRIVLEYIFFIRMSFRGTYGAGAPYFPENSGVLDRICSMITVKGDTKTKLDLTPFAAKYIDQRSKGSLRHCGAVAAAAALPAWQTVKDDGNKLIAPDTTEYVTAEEEFAINRADERTEFQQAVHVADDYRNHDFIVIDFVSKAANEFLAKDSDAMAVDDIKLRIEVVARCLDDIGPKEAVQLYSKRYSVKEETAKSAAELVTFNMAKDGRLAAYHLITRNGDAGQAYSDEVVAKVVHRKDEEKCIITDSDFLKMKSLDDELIRFYDPYVDGKKLTAGCMSFTKVVSDILDSVPNGVRDNNPSQPVGTHELLATLGQGADLTTPVKLWLVEETLLEQPVPTSA